MAEQIAALSHPSFGALDAPGLPDVASENESTAEESGVAESGVVDRRSFLGLGMAACGAALALLAAPAQGAPGLLEYSDRRALRFLEEVEALQADFFSRAAMSAAADG